MGSAIERQCYIVRLSLIGWVHTQNDPWLWSRCKVICWNGTMLCHSINLIFSSQFFFSKLKQNTCIFYIFLCPSIPMYNVVAKYGWMKKPSGYDLVRGREGKTDGQMDCRSARLSVKVDTIFIHYFGWWGGGVCWYVCMLVSEGILQVQYIMISTF